MNKTCRNKFNMNLNKYLIIATIVTLFSLTGYADETKGVLLPTNLLEPAPGPDNFIAVESPLSGENNKPSAGFVTSYQHRPFVVVSCTDNNCGDSSNTIDNVKNALVSDILFSFNFLKRFSAGFAVPIIIWQSGYIPREQSNNQTGQVWLEADESDKFNTYGVVGDIRIHLKGRILGKENSDGFALAAAIIPGLPMSKWTGQGRGYSGSSFLTLTAPKILASYKFGPLKILGNIAFKARKKTEYYSAAIGHALTYGAGVGYDLKIKEDVFSIEFFAEVYGEKNFVSANFNDIESAPLLFNGGAKFNIKKDFTISLAAGGGIISGIGVPQVQGMLGFNWALTTKKDPNAFLQVSEWDIDGDTIDNDVDECPKQPEDIDEFQDEDGCPDLDNDNDGIEDGYDSCPNEPEDKDNFRDEDGCPDLDHDEDGIKEPADKCPNKAEDYDGFEDEDGCPEKDNDLDGIEDKMDDCPLLKEDMDNFQDEDGCPDIDNDVDGVSDAFDKCPDEPETLNGKDDNDGCPDKNRALVTIVNNQFVLSEAIIYKKKSDKFSLTEDIKTQLNIIAQVLKSNTTWKLSIDTYTDSMGKEDANKELTVNRADIIKNMLIESGVETDRINTTGHAADNPVESNDTKAGRDANNRVEFNIIRLVKEKKTVAEDSEETMDFTDDDGGDEDAMDFTIEEEESMDFTGDEN
ncbi:MAG: OmpA family protein [Deltaproteobacteria bacterium]|nr:OmpA family protein [Deltaproteobacteria bacterium]